MKRILTIVLLLLLGAGLLWGAYLIAPYCGTPGSPDCPGALPVWYGVMLLVMLVTGVLLILFSAEELYFIVNP